MKSTNPKRNMRVMAYPERYLRYRSGLRTTHPKAYNMTPMQAAKYRERVDEALKAHRRQVLMEVADNLSRLAGK